MGVIWAICKGQEWEASPARDFQRDGILLVEYGTGAERGTALLAPWGRPVTVNGQRVWGGLRVLQHQDEIQLGGQRVFYSAQMQPRVTAYQGSAETPPKCAVCRTPIARGDAVVACPVCSRLHHQSEQKPCWTYREQCAFCNHPTAMSGDAGWRPEREESDD